MKKIFIPLLSLVIGLLQTGIAAGMTLTSNAFAPQQAIPQIYTCEGRDKTPDLSWSPPPLGTQSFAMIMQDIDAPSGIWTHWVVFNVPATVSQLQSDTANLPTGLINGKNSWGETGYRGPCPPLGKDHHYIFTLYALDGFLSLPPSATAEQVLEATKGHVLAQTQLTGTYHRSH